MVKHFSIFTKAATVQTLWLLSFLGAFLLFPVSDAIQTACVITALTSLLGYAVCTGITPLKYNSLSLIMVGLWVIALNSVLFSEVKIISLTYFFFFSAFPLTFFLFSMVDGKNLLKPIAGVITGIGFFSLVQFYFLPDMLKFGGTCWPFEDNNSLAALLASGVILCMGEALRNDPWSRYFLPAAIILFAGVMTTGGLAVFLALILIFAVLIPTIKTANKRPVWIFIAAVIILFLTMTTSELSLYHFLTMNSETVASLFNKGISENNSLSGDRITIWKSTIEIFKTYPVTGTGIGTFFLYYPEYRTMSEGSAGYMAHNDFLQIASEMGLVAPLLTLALVGFVIFKTVASLKTATSEQRLNVMIPFSVFGLIIGHSLVNFNLYVLPSIMVMGLCLAVWNDAIGNRREIVMPVSKILREGGSFIAVMMVIVPLWGCILSEYYTTKAIDDLNAENIQGFSSDLNMADTWGVGQNGKAILQAARFSAATNNQERAFNLLDRAETINPRLVGIYIDRAQLLESKDLNAALRNAQMALRLDKTSHVARLSVANILLKLHRDEESYAVLKEGLNGERRRTDMPEFFQILSTRALEKMDLATNQEALTRLRRLTSPKVTK